MSLWKNRVVLFLPLASTLFCGVLLGQVSHLSGRVFDESGALIPGATITVRSQSTQMERSQQSDELGRFQFRFLPPGLFTVLAMHRGFETRIYSDVRVEVDSPASIDVVLPVGAADEHVTVTSSAFALNKVNASLGNPMSREQFMGLPLNGRNLAEALSLQPGVTLTGEVTGSRSDQVVLTLDGINVNDQFHGTNLGEPFMPVLRVTPDSVQEFRVTTSNPSANQGRSSGAQVSFITRSGTNEWHGALYEYHRNAATAANDFFNNRLEGDPDRDGEPGMGRPNLIDNVFGGRIGGPIIKERAFVFFNYEGRRNRFQRLQTRTVPLQHLGEGRIKYLGTDDQEIILTPEQIVALYPATGGVNPIVTAILADVARKYPANDPNFGDQLNTSGFRFNADTPLDWNTFTSRLDFNLAENQTLFLRGNYQWDHENDPPAWPDAPSNRRWSHPMGISTGHVWTAQPTLINDLRYGLTRQAFSSSGDSDQDSIGFFRVYRPLNFDRPLSKITLLQNLTNNTSWTRRNHTLQFGFDFRWITSDDENSSGAYDAGYVGCPVPPCDSGLLAPIVAAKLFWKDLDQRSYLANALRTLLGRYSQFTLNSNYGVDGGLLPRETPRRRSFSTQEYEFYFEDSWQLNSSLTVNLGIRWGVNTPLAETTGFQVQPTVSLNDFFERRVAGALQGVPYNESITIDRSGPFYDRPGYYPADWNNFAPRASFAYSPAFEGGLWKAIFGTSGQSVFRGGFAIMYDRVGSTLATGFEFDNTLGFSPSLTTPNDSTDLFDISDNLGPLFTGFNQPVRPLANVEIDGTIEFPFDREPGGRIIESSLDDHITSPINYNWNLSVGRELPGGMFLEVAYVGRSARNLLATRDVSHLNNLVDPQSGMDWYTAAALLYDHRINDTPINEVPSIPFFENLFPNLQWIPGLTPSQNAFYFVSRDGLNLLDWTYLQDALDSAGIYEKMFFHPQYAALSTWSTVARSDYHAAIFSLRKRFQQNLTFDVNYTWSKSMDNASGRQDAGLWSTSGFIANPLLPEASRSVSDFDIQHIVNINWLSKLPIGRGKRWLNNLSGISEALLGGWALNGIFRWNSGLPLNSPFEWERWATNWNIPSNALRIRNPRPAPTKSGDHPNYWADPQYAYNSFRDAMAGEVGDRNVFRIPSYVSLDLGLHKSFRMPYAEGHRLTFAWEAFNVTNTQRLGGLPAPGEFFDWQTFPDPQIGTAPEAFGNIYRTQGRPRVMQFSLRYDF